MEGHHFDKAMRQSDQMWTPRLQRGFPDFDLSDFDFLDIDIPDFGFPEFGFPIELPDVNSQASSGL